MSHGFRVSRAEQSSRQHRFGTGGAGSETERSAPHGWLDRLCLACFLDLQYVACYPGQLASTGWPPQTDPTPLHGNPRPLPWFRAPGLSSPPPASRPRRAQIWSPHSPRPCAPAPAPQPTTQAAPPPPTAPAASRAPASAPPASHARSPPSSSLPLTPTAGPGREW